MIYFCFGNANSRKGLDLDKYKEHGTVVGCNAIYRDFTPDILVALDAQIAHEVYRSGYAHRGTSYLGYWTDIPTQVAEHLLESETGPVSISPGDLGFTRDVVYHGGEGVFTLESKVPGITYITGITKPDDAHEIEPCIDKFKYATGTRAIYLACELGATEVYIIGHDLFSTDDKINNIYADTSCYKKSDAEMPRPDRSENDDMHNWILQHKNTFDTFKDTKFYKVNPNPIGTSPIDIVIPEWHNCNNLEYITQHELDKQFKI
jgi:hypothetical protein